MLEFRHSRWFIGLSSDSIQARSASDGPLDLDQLPDQI
jgi:hypothetical protein